MKIDWHPYPDIKPNHKGEYLVTYNSRLYGERLVNFDSWSNKSGWDIFDEGEVIAWAELPEPYQPYVKIAKQF